jgi:hypothetical protein
MNAFEELFAAEGWEETLDRGVEVGFERIALYALRGIPTHACRQLENGIWTSKLGQYIDLSHELDELEGPEYGEVAKIFRKLSI